MFNASDIGVLGILIDDHLQKGDRLVFLVEIKVAEGDFLKCIWNSRVSGVVFFNAEEFFQGLLVVALEVEGVADKELS